MQDTSIQLTSHTYMFCTGRLGYIAHDPSRIPIRFVWYNTWLFNSVAYCPNDSSPPCLPAICLGNCWIFPLFLSKKSSNSLYKHVRRCFPITTRRRNDGIGNKLTNFYKKNSEAAEYLLQRKQEKSFLPPKFATTCFSGYSND